MVKHPKHDWAVNEYITTKKYGTEIAKEAGVHHDTLYRWVVEAGHEVNLRGRKKQPFDIAGKTFNQLTALEYVGGPRGRQHWRFKCTCGKITIADARKIMSGQTKSCGCLRINNISGSNHPFWCGYEEITGTHWASIKNGATSRNLEFAITVEYAWELFLKQSRKCRLSGIDLIMPVFGRRKNRKNQASLDRIDSSKGYVEGNVQWVSFVLNVMKLNHTQTDFLMYCKMVTDHQEQKQLACV